MQPSSLQKKIYLAGGFHSGWQAAVMRKLRGYEFLDPSQHAIQDAAVYTHWDLEAIRLCDVVLGNMEATNPGGYSLALEVGYAKALNKVVILVDQIDDPMISRYFEMVRQCSDRVVSTLDEAVQYLALKE